MSWQALTWAQAQRTGNPGRKAVLLLLANYADEDGTSFPGQETIAAGTDCDVRTVRRHLAWLEDQGYVEAWRRYDDKGHRTSNGYRLSLEDNMSGRLEDNRSGLEDTGVLYKGSKESDPPEKSRTTQAAEKSGRKRNLIWDALVAMMGWDDGQTATARTRLGKAVRELRQAHPYKADDEIGREVARRALRYRNKYPGADLTPEALIKHWPSLSGRPSPQPRDEIPEAWR